MILTYSLPKFKALILSGEKIHTIRTDAHLRWRPGMSIQHWMGNPRNVKANPHEFAKGECRSMQNIQIMRQGDGIPNVFILAKRGHLSGHFLSDVQVEELAKNDGLTMDEFREWFVPVEAPEFFGRIVHFTDKIY